VIALVIGAGVTAVTWLATDASAGLFALALLLTTLVAVTAGRWGRAERDARRVSTIARAAQSGVEYRAVTRISPF
jgi:hypothetical protein